MTSIQDISTSLENISNMVSKNKERPLIAIIRTMQTKTNLTIANIETVKDKTRAKIKNLTRLNVGKDVEK